MIETAYMSITVLLYVFAQKSVSPLSIYIQYTYVCILETESIMTTALGTKARHIAVTACGHDGQLESQCLLHFNIIITKRNNVLVKITRQEGIS